MKNAIIFRIEKYLQRSDRMDGGPTASIILIVMVLINMIYNGFSAAMEQLNIKEIEEK